MRPAEVLMIATPVQRLRRRPYLPMGPAVFLTSLGIYSVATWVLVFGLHVVAFEALSHVGNAYYVLYSRDPHLAAIGFVWNPLPSLLALIVLPLKAVWPEVVTLGLAASAVSVVFMAGSVYLVYRLLGDFHLSSAARIAMTALFGLHPLVLYVAAAGLPQAMFLYFVLLAIASLSSWMEHGRLLHLIRAGVALALAYLVTPAAVAVFAGALLLTAYQSHRALARDRADRRLMIACDVLLLAAPVLLALGTWAAATWLITGDLLHQLSSIYAVRSQLVVMGESGMTLNETLRRLVILEPGLLGLTAMIVLRFVRAWTPQLVAAVCLLVPVVGLELLGQTVGMVQLSLAPLIGMIPLALVIAAVTAEGTRPAIQRATAIVVLAAGIPAGLAGVAQSGLLQSNDSQVAAARSVAAFLDSHRLADGSVLIDTASGFPIVLSSHNPRQFVITNDRDFRLALSDPVGMGVRYLVVPASTNSASVASLDALVRTYPGLYETGAGLGQLVAQFGSPGEGAEWRLYQVSSG